MKAKDMNIFSVLSQGKGRLNEENLSAMLGFLLSPNQAHGFGDVFLRRFLLSVAQKCGDGYRFDRLLASKAPIHADVVLESPYAVGARKRVVDIEIKIYGNNNSGSRLDVEVAETHRIAIENKVYAQAADEKQLQEEFLGILQDVEGEEGLDVTMVFLTPPGGHDKLSAEYHLLDHTVLGRHKKSWLHWYEGDGDNHLVGLIRQLLRDEANAEIPPMTEYLRHTLKAFVGHVLESPAGIAVKGLGTPATSNPTELGNIVQIVGVAIAAGNFQIERYENSTIRVLNLDTSESEITKPRLREINEEKQLDIDLYLGSGREKNTRTLGKDVMRELVAQGKSLGE